MASNSLSSDLQINKLNVNKINKNSSSDIVIYRLQEEIIFKSEQIHPNVYNHKVYIESGDSLYFYEWDYTRTQLKKGVQTIGTLNIVDINNQKHTLRCHYNFINNDTIESAYTSEKIFTCYISSATGIFKDKKYVIIYNDTFDTIGNIRSSKYVVTNNLPLD